MTGTLLNIILAVFGVAGVLAAMISVAVFAKTAGTIQALKDTAETYKGLYEAEREKSEQHAAENAALRNKLIEMDERIKSLETKQEARKEIDDEWVSRLFLAAMQGGICEVPECPKRVTPDRRGGF